MASYKSYIPQPDPEFDEWAENFNVKLPAIATLLSIPPDLVTAVSDAFTDWDTAFDAHTVAKNAQKAATEVKDEARVSLQTAIRIVAQLLQKHPDLTDEQRETLGITVPDKVRTPSSPDYIMTLPPPLVILVPARSLVTVHFGVNPGNEKKNAKPAGVAGAKIWYRVEGGSWNFVALDTNSPYNHNLTITESASLEYRAQWYDNLGRTGTFSAPVAVAVTP